MPDLHRYAVGEPYIPDRTRWPGDAAYDAQVQDVYRRFPDSSMLAMRAAARTLGGA